MNGRCDKDPFNRAIDVCDNCYLDVCEDCSVMLRGRSEPICRRCARDLTTVGGSKKKRRRGNRKTAKERRARYRAEDGNPSDRVFTYFDEAAPESANDDQSEDTTRRRSWIRRVVDGLETNPQASRDADNAKHKRPTAVDQLDVLRGEDEADDEEHREPPSIESPNPFDNVDDADYNTGPPTADRKGDRDDDEDPDTVPPDEALQLSQRVRPFLEAKRS